MYLEAAKLEIVQLIKKLVYDIGYKRSLSPPHLVKREIIKCYARKYNLDVLVETGTYKGEMIFALKNIFKEIHSIELSEFLYKRSVKRFANQSHIHLYCGDSKTVLPAILEKIKSPCLFWLDAHYSGGITACSDKESPIVDELHNIFVHPINKHIILIDDARCFNGSNDYPTVEELFRLVETNKQKWSTYVKEDIIRVTPKN
ncbi:hypothetical protein [Scytonema sp. PCC 10023]|uniref:hypothetical protein n=1 Tax=Scytonema sp. PCC 10023 TaxID=1680591 RepID=UPI0039C6C22B